MDRPSLARRLEGPGFALLAVLAVELVAHGPWPAPSPYPSVLLILGLLTVVHGAFRGGLGPGLLAAATLALYAMHMFSPHREVLVLGEQVVRSGFLVFLIGAVMALFMSRLKRREDKLRAALVAKADELERRNRELRRANETLEAFTYVVAHDLKEPVRAIENYLEAAQEEYGGEEGRGFTEKAHRANRRMADLLQGLLAYGRASVAPSTMHDVSVPRLLAEPARRAVFDEALRERGATLEVDPDLPLVRADETGLAQALGNLILNAVRHNDAPAPRVRVRAGDADEARVELHVDDDGPGFPPEVLRRFEGEGPSPSTVKGGFGLLIARRAVHAMGGRMRLGRSPEGGGRVTLELPRAPPREPEE